MLKYIFNFEVQLLRSIYSFLLKGLLLAACAGISNFTNYKSKARNFRWLQRYFLEDKSLTWTKFNIMSLEVYEITKGEILKR